MSDPSDTQILSLDNSKTANTLRDELVEDVGSDSSQKKLNPPNWEDLPSVPNTQITPLELPSELSADIKDVTEGDNTLNGVGSFDIFMKALRANLEDMKAKGTLDNPAISNIISNVIPSFLEQAVNFSLQSKQAAIVAAGQAQEAQASYWRAVASQQAAYQSQAEAYNSRIASYIALEQLKNQKIAIALQKLNLVEENEKINLLRIQAETANAQISDTLSNGNPVGGTIGLDNKIKDQQILNMQEQIKLLESQIRLYSYQTRAYDLDGKIKVASIWSSNYQVLVSTGTLDKVPDVLSLDNTNKVYQSLATASGLWGKSGIDGDFADGT